MAEVAPATKEVEEDRWVGRHLILWKPDDLKKARLRIPTRFDLGNIRFIPWTLEFFPEPEWGYLSETGIAELNMLLRGRSKQ